MVYGWYGMVRYGMVLYVTVWYGMVWYGTVWFGMVWYGAAENKPRQRLLGVMLLSLCMYCYYQFHNKFR
jgi:hypothetical protein